MIKTFKKAIAIMLTLAFMFTLVPVSGLADNVDGTTATIRFSNPFWHYTKDGNEDNTYDYSAGMRAGTVSNAYKAIAQLDFTGYEYLLWDENSTFTGTFPASIKIGSGTRPLYDFGMFILDDASDEYGEHYEVYSDADNGMTWNEITRYITPLTSIDGLTPLISKTAVASAAYTSDASKQVVKDAFLESPDDSIITLQIVRLVSDTNNGKLGVSNASYFTLTGSGSYTPADYVNEIADMITWDKMSTQDMSTVTSSLTLFPSNYLGTTIDWESSNEAAVNSETGTVTVNPAANTDVTLTATISYQPYEGKAVTTKKTFNIRLPKDKYDYSSGNGTYYDGSINFISSYGSSTSDKHYPKVTIMEEGLAGKASNDKYYMIQDASGNRRFNLVNTNEKTGYPNRDVVEFSICIPDGCYGFSNMIKFNDLAGNSGTYGGEFAFKTEGIYETRFNKLLFPWDGNRWHHVAIMSPGVVSSDASGVKYDTYVRIYVDGILVHDEDLSVSYKKPNGVGYYQSNGLCPQSDHDENNKKDDGTHNVKGTNWTTVACYLDNVRYTHEDIDDIVLKYNTLSNIASSVYDVDYNAETLTVVGSATVEQIINSLTVDEDATTRVYSDGILIEDTSVAANDNMTIVVADTNGTLTERTYAYYDIRVISDGEYAFDIPYITFADNKVTGTVKLFNNTASAKTYKLYIAVYNDNKELIEVIPASLTAESGETKSITTNAVSYEGAEKAKLFIWEEDGIKPALADVLYK